MTDKSQTSLEYLMRAGYAARGAVYFLVGAIAVFAAVNGGEAEGSTGAMEHLVKQPLGKVMLGFVAAGLFAYTAWRVADGLIDLENEGDDTEGYLNRAGQILSGATHAFLGVTAISILVSGASADDGGQNTAESWSEALMSQPLGRWIVILAGVVTFSVGIYLFFKAKQATYKSKIRNNEVTEMLAPFVRFGLVAHGVVLLIIGGLIASAGWTTDANQAAGLAETLKILETQTFGRTLLGIAGAGMIGFAAYCGVMARYRVSPTENLENIKTLAEV